MCKTWYTNSDSCIYRNNFIICSYERRCTYIFKKINKIFGKIIFLEGEGKYFDEKSFENAVARCMQSNGIMNDFVDKINIRLSEKTYEFRSIDKSDTDKIQSTKNEIEQLV